MQIWMGRRREAWLRHGSAHEQKNCSIPVMLFSPLNMEQFRNFTSCK